MTKKIRKLLAFATIIVLSWSVISCIAGRSDANSSVEEMEVDVVVVGGGGAGLSAAISATQYSAGDVMIIEKGIRTGGNTREAGSSVNALDLEAQKRLILSTSQKNSLDKILSLSPNDTTLRLSLFPEWKPVLLRVQDDIRRFYAANAGKTPDVDMPGFDSEALFEWHIYINGVRRMNDGTFVASSEPLARQLVKESMNTINWLHDMTLISDELYKAPLRTVLGAVWPRTHTTLRMSKGMGILTRKAKELGVKILTETAGKELLTDENGRVVGVKAEQSDGKTLLITARKGVVLACGGYAANAALVKKYDKYWGDALSDDTKSTNVPTNTGDGIVMATKIGATTTGMEVAQMMPSSSPVTGKLRDGIWGDASEQIWVDASCHRFVDEYAGRDVLVKASLKLENGVFYIICGGVGKGKGKRTGLVLDDEFFGKSVRQLHEQGHIWLAGNLKDLAEATKKPADGLAPAFTEQQLREVIERYNGFVEQQKDLDCGKSLIEGGIDIKAIEDNPNAYIAITPRKASLHHTMGGLKTDENARVLNAKGSPIPGLYAAGEVTGGLHAGNRMGGNALSEIFTFGRIAGRNVSKEIGKE